MDNIELTQEDIDKARGKSEVELYRMVENGELDEFIYEEIMKTRGAEDDSGTLSEVFSKEDQATILAPEEGEMEELALEEELNKLRGQADEQFREENDYDLSQVSGNASEKFGRELANEQDSIIDGVRSGKITEQDLPEGKYNEILWQLELQDMADKSNTEADAEEMDPFPVEDEGPRGEQFYMDRDDKREAERKLKKK